MSLTTALSIVILKWEKNQSPKSIRDSLESEWHSECTLICAQISLFAALRSAQLLRNKMAPAGTSCISESDEFLKRIPFPFPLSPCALKSHVSKSEEKTNNELLPIKTWHTFLEQIHRFSLCIFFFLSQTLEYNVLQYIYMHLFQNIVSGLVYCPHSEK